MEIHITLDIGPERLIDILLFILYIKDYYEIGV